MAALVVRATTADEALAYIGAMVSFNPNHPDNEDDMMITLIGDAKGEIVDSYIVEDSPKAGVHAVAVEFLSPQFSGLIRAVAAERFVLKMDA